MRRYRNLLATLLLMAWLVLVLTGRIPAIVFHNKVTVQLQSLNLSVAATVLPRLGVPVQRKGRTLDMPSKRIEITVVGARSAVELMLLLAPLAVLYGSLMEKRLWVRWLLGLVTVPLAVAANLIRFIGYCFLLQYWDSEAAYHYFDLHSMKLIIFLAVSLISLTALVLLHLLIKLVWKGSPQVKPA